MPALPIASTNISGSASISSLEAGESISPGQFVYKKAADNRAYVADNGTEAEAEVIGMAINYASATTSVGYVASGTVTTTGLTAGIVALGSTGQHTPLGSVGSGDYLTLLGNATSTTTLELGITRTGATV